MYYIWFDESDKEGEFYSNFYGGILIKSEHLEKVLQMMKCIVEEVGLSGEGFLYKLNTDDVFNKGNIILAKGDIREVDSKKHLPLQLMDLILGAICFRLNDKHKIKDPETNRRGKRTKLKEQLYKHINSRIRKIKPGFNIGESTATILPSDKWEYPYMHWSFKPSNNIRDFTKSKGYKNSPHTSTE